MNDIHDGHLPRGHGWDTTFPKQVFGARVILSGIHIKVAIIKRKLANYNSASLILIFGQWIPKINRLINIISNKMFESSSLK